MLMAPGPYSVESAKSSLLKDGFYHLVGIERPEQNVEMEQDNFALSSEYGLDFCKRKVLDDTVGRQQECSWSCYN
jgi:hypothetical protein